MDDRVPLSVRLLGVMHKEASKMYMASVLWSDQNEIIVYRSLKDFKSLHKQLKKKYAKPSQMNRSGRVIPKFKAGKTPTNVQKKALSKSVMRLKSLEEYCTELLNSEPRVLQSPELLQFFLPNDQDLKPEFARNSIVIMPSEDPGDASTGAAPDAGVTQPFVTETYRCIAPYETKDTKNRPFKVEIDESLDVLIKDKAGWWLVENEAKSMAWFPAPYLEKPEDDADSDPENNGESILYVAAKSYKSKNRDELSVDVGSVVEVIQKSENGWWLIRYNVKTGYVPAMFLQPYTHPRVRMVTMQQERRNSTLNLAELQAPAYGSLQVPNSELSRSQGNLLQIPGNTMKPTDRLKSRSLNILSDDLQSPAHYQVPPIITVEAETDSRSRNPSGSSAGSEFSFSDEGSVSGSESLNLSQSDMAEQLQRSRTPPPIMTDRLSPGSPTEGRLMPSKSDPNLFKAPATPKVPPRPRAQEILQRCTTVTRKNALTSKSQLSPGQPVIQSR